MSIDNQLILAPDNIPVLSKQNAATFHQMAKERIYENGGAFEYVEMIKFCSLLDKQINGDSASKIEADKEFISYLRDEIERNGEKGKYTTGRGVKFEIAETGSSYDFSKCDDPVLVELEEKAKEAADAVKSRKEFLKTIPLSGLDTIIEGTGEVVKLFPPSKSSKSSFKVSLPK